MGVSIRYRLKWAAVFFLVSIIFLMAFAGTQPAKVEARANLTAYASTPPGSWEPMGYDVNGTAPWLVIQTLGYNATTILGNVGIGNGGVKMLNNTSNRDVNYTEDNLIAADISLAPWDPGRLTGAGSPEKAGGLKNISSAPDNETTGAKGMARNESDNKTGQLNGGVRMALADQYHSILLGRPVDDLLYEYPVEPPGNMYARLIGLSLPSGSVANMGIKCAGYGF